MLWCASARGVPRRPGARPSVPGRGWATCSLWPRSHPETPGGAGRASVAARPRCAGPRLCPRDPAPRPGGAFFKCQAHAGNDLPQHRMADADPMRVIQPRPQLPQLRVRPRGDLRAQSAGQRSQTQWHVIMLRTRGRITKVAKACPNLRHIGRAHPKTGGHLHKGQIWAGQNPVTKILPVSLSTSPCHVRLRYHTETLESHFDPVSEPQIGIPVREISV